MVRRVTVDKRDRKRPGGESSGDTVKARAPLFLFPALVK